VGVGPARHREYRGCRGFRAKGLYSQSPINPLAALVTALLLALTTGGSNGPGSSPPFGVPAPRAIAIGSVGHDISWPQCGKGQPAGGAFGIVGVTGGRPYTANPCLTSQFAWAEATPGGAGFYMNTSNPGSAAVALNWYAQNSPDAACRPGNDAACAYDYGFNAATAAFNHAVATTGAGAGRVWWLDVEPDNSWSSTDIVANRAAVQGSIDSLQRQPGVIVGIYSTARMWNRIMGNFQLPLPNWVAGANNAAEAIAHCAPAFSATGGPAVLSQWVEAFDNNYVC